MQIEYLADHPSLVPELASLHFAQWGYPRPAETLEGRTRRLEGCCGRDGVPSAVVALESGELAGSAMLIASDMAETRPGLTPWLAGLYVVEAYRGRGYGSALVGRIESDASALGVERLYLYTPDAEDFYAALGWTVHERCEHLGQQVAVMSKALGQTA